MEDLAEQNKTKQNNAQQNEIQAITAMARTWNESIKIAAAIWHFEPASKSFRLCMDIFMWIYDARETMLISFEIHLIYRIELIKCVNLANSMDENVKRSN